MQLKSIFIFLFILVIFTLGNFGNLAAQLNCDATVTGYSYEDGHQADRWYFGDHAGLDFRGQEPVADLTNDSMWINSSPSIIADNAGNILLFSDGYQIFNRLNEIMLNGDSLHGFPICTMTSLIVPKPGSDELYYVFTIDRPKTNPYDTINPRYGLEYNVVNMELDNGLGAVVEKNRVLTEPELSSKITGVKHSNGIDYWILVHRFDSDEFCAFLLTENGIDSANYVSSHIGSFHLGPGSLNNGIGYMKLSPDGNHLALNIWGMNRVELFDFNTTTGEVTNAVSSPTVFKEAYGLEFSPDSKLLYVSTTSTSLPNPGYTPTSYLFQFDIQKGSAIFLQGNYDTLAVDSSGSYFSGLQLGTDGRIYVTRAPNGNGYLSVFQNPIREGNAANFTLDTLYLEGRFCRYGLPDFLSSWFYLPHFDIDYEGSSETVDFQLQNASNIDSVLWNFGDPASSQNTSKELQPTHQFSAPGTYVVSVTEYFNGIAYGPYLETISVNLIGVFEPEKPPQFSRIYPNPAKDRLMFTLPDFKNNGPMNITIHNLYGQEVIHGGVICRDGEVMVDVSALTQGIYLAVLRDERSVLGTGKFVVAR